MPPALRGAAVGLLALLRNEGGSVGMSIGQTITERREIFHALRLNENLDLLNPAVNSYIAQAQQGFLQQTEDPAGAQQMAWQSLENLREQQASALSYFDAFLIFAALGVMLAFLLVPVMKQAVAEKGAHLAADWRLVGSPRTQVASTRQEHSWFRGTYHATHWLESKGIWSLS
jgi:DHA2 family multidrug resistance protein